VEHHVWWKVILAIVAITPALVVFPVLEVVKAKLSVQKIGATHTALPTQERETQPEVVEYPEEVVGFRQEPYGGFFDSVKRIANEEGAKSLFRLWWVSAIVTFFLSGTASWVF